jgi:ABC-type amino acid transport substrate-binding protein
MFSDFLDDYNSTHGGRIVVVPQTDTQFGVISVQANRLDAMLLDAHEAYYWAKKDQLRMAGEVGSPAEICFGTRPGDTVLRDQLKAALADAGGNGQYANAYTHWFGRQPTWKPGS